MESCFFAKPAPSGGFLVAPGRLTGKQLPVSQLVHTADQRIITLGEWKLTTHLVNTILDRAGQIDMELGEGLPPNSTLLLEIQEAVEELIKMF